MRPLFLLAAALSFAAIARAQDPLPLPYAEGWVAKVNGDAILASDVIKKMGAKAEGLKNAFPDKAEYERALEIEFDQTLFRMALDRVVEQEAKKHDILVSNDEVETELNEDIKREAGGNREKFKDQIGQKGFTISSYSDMLRAQILGNKVLGGTFDHSAIFVRPEEVIEYFKAHPAEFSKPERVRPRVLPIVARGPGAAEKALRYAQGLKRQVEAGADFAGLVKWSSADVESDAPVDLDWRKRGDLDPALVQPVFDAPVGTLVGPVQGAPVRGEPTVYLVMVEGHEPAEAISFEESQAEISSKLRQEKVSREFSRANHFLLTKAVVEFRVEACRLWFERQREEEAGR